VNDRVQRGLLLDAEPDAYKDAASNSTIGNM
jgi:hypothetical protein